MSRTAETLLKEGKRQQAVDIVDKYFEGFPHFNFPYNAETVPFINMYVQSGQNEKAIHHLRILGQETKEFLEFYDSIDPETQALSFKQDFGRRQNSMINVLALANRIGDEAFKKEMEDLLGQYRTQAVPN